MNYCSLIILLFLTIQSFGQSDTIKKSYPSKRVHIGHPGNAKPLFILNGKPVTEKEAQNIKPETIESMTVLKDSVAKSQFGLQARNGVIIIKTKKISKRELRKMKKKSQ